MTYTRLKTLITRGQYNKEDMLNQMDVFLLADRMTNEQYNELISLMNSDNNEVN